MTPMPETPALVRWRVDLEGAVSVKGDESASSRQRATLFVGFGSLFASSGLLDFNPNAAPRLNTWVDAITKTQVRPALSPLAPADVEIVRRENK
jgi:hypothetical protein